MPTNRTRRRHGRRADVRNLDADLLRGLLHGRGFFNDFTTADLRAAWAVWGEWILAVWVDAYPGTRPFGWWLCEAPGERKTTEGFDADRAEHQARFDRGENVITPAAYLDQYRMHGVMHTDYWPAMQEAEVDFLRREGLLSAEEEAAVAAAAPHDEDEEEDDAPHALFKRLLAEDGNHA